MFNLYPESYEGMCKRKKNTYYKQTETYIPYMESLDRYLIGITRLSRIFLIFLIFPSKQLENITRVDSELLDHLSTVHKMIH